MERITDPRKKILRLLVEFSYLGISDFYRFLPDDSPSTASHERRVRRLLHDFAKLGYLRSFPVIDSMSTSCRVSAMTSISKQYLTAQDGETGVPARQARSAADFYPSDPEDPLKAISPQPCFFLHIHRYAIGSRTSPARTGFNSMYSILSPSCSSCRSPRSNDSCCQTVPRCPSSLLMRWDEVLLIACRISGRLTCPSMCPNGFNATCT